MAVKKTSTTKKTTEKKMVDELIPEVEVNEEAVEEVIEPIKEPEVEINTDIDDSKMPAKNVKIKMKENHNCWVGKEHYILKKGQCYNVPLEVKMRLSKAGLLLPL